MLKTLGFTKRIINKNQHLNLNTVELARVIAIHKNKTIVKTEQGVFQAELTGNLRYSANDPSELPAVGDWVTYIPMDINTVVINGVLNRYSTLKRKAVSKAGEVQLIASNIDIACVVMAVNQDFNLNRLDRYFSICYSGQIQPILLLTKTDLVSEQELEELVKQVKNRHNQLEIHLLTMFSIESVQQFKNSLQANKTYCFIGSSGVGKSTLINILLNANRLKTQEISQSHQKGKHTTSHRELFLLENEAIVIDTPGMRELGLANVNNDGLEATFTTVLEYASQCKFADCTHTTEIYCGVLKALDNELLSRELYDSYLKLQREQDHYNKTRHQRKKQEKQLSKHIRKFQLRKGNKKF